MSDLTTSFNSGAETKAQQVLEAHFGGGGDLAQKLATAKTDGQDSLRVTLGYQHEIGELDRTKAFTDCRAALLKRFPEVKDVRFEVGGDFWPRFADVQLDLKEAKPDAATPKKRWRWSPAGCTEIA